MKILSNKIADFLEKEVKMSGWVYSVRRSGKIGFLTFRDGFGIVQCIVAKNDVGEEKFELFKSLSQESSIILHGKAVLNDRAPGGVEVITEDIGFPSIDKEKFPGMYWELNPRELARQNFQKPDDLINKSSAGKILIIAGSKGMTGAAILATYGALRSGAGVTITINPNSLNDIYEKTIIEGMTFSVEDNNNGFLAEEHYDIIMGKVDWADSVVLGPGLGRNPSTQNLIKKLVSNIRKPIVLDADGLYPFSNNIEILCQRDSPLIITPHLTELARLLGCKKEMILSDFSNVMKDFRKKYKQVCMVKQVPACILFENSIRINTTGNPGLASAGTGDVLTGIIASLVSQGLNCYDAASVGAYIHGQTSDELVERKGYRGQLSSDLVEFLPYAIRSYEKL